VQELIAMLSKYPPDTPVAAYDADAECFQEVTGLVHVPDENVVELQTDEVAT
jgi:hypothetical protein